MADLVDPDPSKENFLRLLKAPPNLFIVLYCSFDFLLKDKRKCPDRGPGSESGCFGRIRSRI